MTSDIDFNLDNPDNLRNWSRGTPREAPEYKPPYDYYPQTDFSALHRAITKHQICEHKRQAVCLFAGALGRFSVYEMMRLDPPEWGIKFIDESPSNRKIRENVRSVIAMVFDLDAMSAEEVQETFDALTSDNIYFVGHTTHSHQPDKPKWRVWAFLDMPWMPEALAEPTGFTEHDLQTSVWVTAWGRFRDRYAPKSDASCKDTCRFYYAPSCSPSELVNARVVIGTGKKCVSLLSLIPTKEEVTCYHAQMRAEAVNKSHVAVSSGKSGAHAPRGNTADGGAYLEHPLSWWLGKYGRTIQLERIFEEAGLVKSERGRGGVFIECFQEEIHQPSEERAWVEDGNPLGDGFTLSCKGGTANCCDIGKADRLLAYIRGYLIDIESLESAEYGGGALPDDILLSDTTNNISSLEQTS
jgi:hypothetical protein